MQFRRFEIRLCYKAACCHTFASQSFKALVEHHLEHRLKIAG